MLSRIVDLVSSAIMLRMQSTLSQQMSRMGAPAQARTGLSAFVGRVFSQQWSDRLNLGKPSSANQQRLDASGKQLNAEQQAEHSAGQEVTKAKEAYAEEVKNPTGKNLADMQIAIIDYEKALRDAADKLKKTTASHKHLKQEVDRQTKWEAARNKSNLWGPSHAIAKTKQAARVLGKRWQRAKSAFQNLTHAKQSLSVARAHHAKNVARQAKAQKAFSAAKTPATSRALASAKAATTRSAAKMASASAARTAAGMAAGRAGMGAAAALPAMLNPVTAIVAAVVAAVAVTVIAMKAFVNRQLAKSEQLIQGQIRQHAQFNTQVANAMSRYERKMMELDMKTARETAGSSGGVIKSQERLKEAQQPTNSRWENIGNHIQKILNEEALKLQQMLNAIDIVTPSIEATVDWLRWIRGDTKATADAVKKTKGSFTLDLIQAGVEGNEEGRAAKKRPALPPIR